MIFFLARCGTDPSVDCSKRAALLTVTSLVSMGITDGSLSYHLQNAKNHGVSKAEIAGILTQVGVLCGLAQWPGLLLDLLGLYGKMRLPPLLKRSGLLRAHVSDWWAK